MINITLLNNDKLLNITKKIFGSGLGFEIVRFGWAQAPKSDPELSVVYTPEITVIKKKIFVQSF